MKKIFILMFISLITFIFVLPNQVYASEETVDFSIYRTGNKDKYFYIYQSNTDVYDRLDYLLSDHFSNNHYLTNNIYGQKVIKQLDSGIIITVSKSNNSYDGWIDISESPEGGRQYTIRLDNVAGSDFAILFFYENDDLVYSNDNWPKGDFNFEGAYSISIGLTYDGKNPLKKDDPTNTYNPNWWVLETDGYYYLKSSLERGHGSTYMDFVNFKLIVPDKATLEYDTYHGPAPEYSPIQYAKLENTTWYMNGFENTAQLGSFNPNDATLSMLGMYPIDYGAYRYSFKPFDDSELYTDLEDLPDTGNFFDNQDNVANVTTSLVENELIVKIHYKSTMLEKTYWYKVNLAENQDTSMFKDNYEAFYYTDDDGKYIIFNHGTESMFRQKSDTFIPYTIWNLSTNEFKSTLNFDVYIYLKEESANNYYAYFYVDEFIIDRLISATVSMQYRYVPLIGKKGDWQPYFKTLEDTNITSGNVSWEVKAATISTAITVGGAFIPGIGLPILLVGTPISFYLQYQMWDQLLNDGGFVSGSINEIEKVTPSTSLKAEVSGAYKNVYTNFEGINLDQLYKLHLGKFDKPLQKDVEINMEFSEYENQKGLNIIQFRYMTDGKIHTVKGEDLSINPNPGDMGPSDPDITIPDIKLPDGLSDNLPIYILLAVLILTFVGSIFSGMLFRRRGLRNLIFIFVFEVSIYLLYVFGIFDLIMRL